MPQVSVIIPTYNRAEYLPLAISSVQNQTFQDFVVIVVDDASQDNTFEAVSSFRDERIKYLRHELTKGGSAARNTGIINSTTQYIAFLDDDDEWLPEKLAAQVNVLANSGPDVGVAYTGYLIIDRENGRVTDQRKATERGYLLNNLLAGNCVGGASSVLLKRKCFEKVGLFDVRLPSFQDYDMWLRVAKHFMFEPIGEPLFKYYLHEKKIWTNLDAIRKGMEIMLSKYGDSPAFRRNSAYQYLSLGVQYCDIGNSRRGRDALLKAIGLYPFEIRNYFNLGLSLFGTRNFRRIKETAIWRTKAAAASEKTPL